MSGIAALLTIEALMSALLNETTRIRILEVGFGNNDKGDFEKNHIPGAMFFDGLRCMGHSGSLCRGLPDPDCFEDYVVTELRISSLDHIVLYDHNKRAPNLLAARTWWLFRTFGHDTVSVLNGGYCSWCKLKDACFESGSGLDSCAFNGKLRKPEVPFRVKLRPQMISTYADVFHNLNSKEKQLIDSRSEAEFQGHCAPRMKGQRLGHVPGAKNVPFTELLDLVNGTFVHNIVLKQVLASKGVNVNKPSIAMCNMGLTASSIIISLHVLGNNNTSIYCGSWNEWSTIAPKEYIEKGDHI